MAAGGLLMATDGCLMATDGRRARACAYDQKVPRHATPNARARVRARRGRGERGLSAAAMAAELSLDPLATWHACSWLSPHELPRRYALVVPPPEARAEPKAEPRTEPRTEPRVGGTVAAAIAGAAAGAATGAEEDVGGVLLCRSGPHTSSAAADASAVPTVSELAHLPRISLDLPSASHESPENPPTHLPRVSHESPVI